MSNQLSNISNNGDMRIPHNEVSQSQESTLVKYDGRDARLQINPLSVLADAQEEIGFIRAGNGDLKLDGEHKPKIAHSNRNTVTALASSYLDAQAASDTLEAGTPDLMLKKLKKAIDKNSTEREAKKLLNQVLDENQFHTSHEKYAALQQLQNIIKADKTGLEHVDRIVNISLSSMTIEDGSSINAGFNIDHRIKTSKGLGRPSDIVDIYQNVVTVNNGVSEIYKKITKKYGLEKLKVSLEFLMGAAGDDINSIGPSTSRTQIRSSLNSLNKLQMIASIQQECLTSTDKIKTWIKPNLKTNAMLESVLEIIDNQWPLATDVHDLCLRIVVDKPQANVAFLHQLSSLSCLIPHQAFEDEGVRENLIEVVRQARNESVTVEEAETDENT